MLLKEILPIFHYEHITCKQQGLSDVRRAVSATGLGTSGLVVSNNAPRI